MDVIAENALLMCVKNLNHAPQNLRPSKETEIAEAVSQLYIAILADTVQASGLPTPRRSPDDRAQMAAKLAAASIRFVGQAEPTQNLNAQLDAEKNVMMALYREIIKRLSVD